MEMGSTRPTEYNPNINAKFVKRNETTTTPWWTTAKALPRHVSISLLSIHLCFSLMFVSLSLANTSRYESRPWIKNKSNNHHNGKQI
ncbi:hypothetical protein GmHk_15G043130 [Glycine max]|nr:hypothetical protein GmHk_15G043130 [Glycine max]